MPAACRLIERIAQFAYDLRRISILAPRPSSASLANFAYIRRFKSESFACRKRKMRGLAVALRGVVVLLRRCMPKGKKCDVSDLRLKRGSALENAP